MTLVDGPQRREHAWSGNLASARVTISGITAVDVDTVEDLGVFGDAHYDELDDARETARYFGTDHHEQIVQPDGVRVAEALAYHYDEPFADASAIPSYHVAALARRHVTVCLTGDGGDELSARLPEPSARPRVDVEPREPRRDHVALVFSRELSAGNELDPAERVGDGPIGAHARDAQQPTCPARRPAHRGCGPAKQRPRRLAPPRSSPR